MSYPYRLIDKQGIVHIADENSERALYTRCERDERGHAKPRFFGEGSLVIVGNGPSCLWCVTR